MSDFIHELLLPQDQFAYHVGHLPRLVMVPRWRKRELINAIGDRFPAPFCCGCSEPDGYDFALGGLKGRWWNRDYIEYQL